MEVINQNPSKKVWLKWVVLAAIVLIATLSLINYYQISVVKMKAPVPTSTQNQPIEIAGTIQRSDIEGGCWYIQPEAPECKGDQCPLGLPANYEPLNLPKELQKTGLKVKFKLEVQTGVATICQIGPAVKILEYQIIK